MFQSLLIANRGEIACRIIRTARRILGLSLAVACNAPIEQTRFGVFRM